MNIPLRQYFELLIKYLKPQKRKVILLSALLLMQIGLQLLNPQLLRRFIDSAIAGAPMDALLGIALLFIAVALLTQALVVAVTYVGQDVGWTATNALRVELAQHLLDLDLAFHKTRTPGELIERIDGDISAMANFFSQFALLVLGNALLLVGVLIVLWRADWRVGLALSVFTLISLALLNRVRSAAIAPHVAVRQSHAVLDGFLEERLAGLDDIRANGAGAYVARRFHELQRDVYQKVIRAEMVGTLVHLTSIFCFALIYIGSLALGAWLFQAGLITVGAIFLLLRYADMLREPMMQITRQLQELQKASAGIVRVRELLRLTKTIRDGHGAGLPAGALAVTFRDVSFEYDDLIGKRGAVSTVEETNGSTPVLHELNFYLAPGKTLGLLGRTGSGKTTLTRLLLRLYEPCAGEVLLGGVDIRAMRLSDLRDAIGMVTQDVHLFRASLRDNLTLFDSSIDDEQILRALDELGLWAWYQALPAGLDSELAPGGGGLSAGQAQLLVFTRVLLKNPSLVILDEASARLDPATERLIERAVDRLLLDRTGIIIAHRLGTVQRAHEIMILEEGRIVEHGARVVLANNPQSRFYRLLQTGLEEVLV